MSHDDAYLVDILDSAKIALGYVSGKTWEPFQRDIQCQDAVVRRIEIIGEAARRVSEETRKRHPQIPWREMAGMRNLVIHEYDVVDPSQVWNTVQKSIPDLIQALSKFVPPE